MATECSYSVLQGLPDQSVPTYQPENQDESQILRNPNSRVEFLQQCDCGLAQCQNPEYVGCPASSDLGLKGGTRERYSSLFARSWKTNCSRISLWLKCTHKRAHVTMISDEENFREGPNPLNRIYISWVQGYKSAGEGKSSRIPGFFLTLWWAWDILRPFSFCLGFGLSSRKEKHVGTRHATSLDSLTIRRR